MSAKTEYMTNGKTFGFNDHVCIECLFGVPDEKRTGRLVQVRKGCGQFGSDVLLIRLRDGGMAAFENALIRHANDREFEYAFYRSNGKQPPVIPEQPANSLDSTNEAYGIANKHWETGFIIENPKQPRTPGNFTIKVKSPSETRIESHISQ